MDDINDYSISILFERDPELKKLHNEFPYHSKKRPPEINKAIEERENSI